MTDNATPKKKRPTYSRPTKFPDSLPRVMTTPTQRMEVEAFADENGYSLGEAVRELIDAGLDNVVRTTRP